MPAGDNQAYYYDGRFDMSNFPVEKIFSGYHPYTIVTNFEEGEPYESSSQFPENPRVILGTQEVNEDSESTTFASWAFTDKLNLPGSPTDGGGLVLSEFDEEWFTDKSDETKFTRSIKVPKLSEDDFKEGNNFNIYGYEGYLLKMKDEDEQDLFVYILPDPETCSTENFKPFFWNCLNSRWEPLDMDGMRLQNINELIFTDEGTGVTGKESLASTFVYELSAEKLLSQNIDANQIDPLNKTPDGNDIQDFAGIANKQTLQANIDAVRAQWGLNLKMLISNSSDQNSAEPTNPPENGPRSAAESFGCQGDADVIYWLHVNKDGTAGLKIKFTDKYFQSKLVDLPEAEKEETKSVLIDALKLAFEATEEGMRDANAANNNDPDDANQMENPWFFGKRLGNNTPINWFTVGAEVLGVGKKTISEVKIHQDLWDPKAKTLFDLPGGIVGLANGLIEENPVAAMAQTVAFGVSFVKEESVRDGIVEIVKHPLKTAGAIYKSAKKDISGQNGIEKSHEVMAAGSVQIIVIILSGGQTLINKIKNVKDAKKIADDIDVELNDLPDVELLDTDAKKFYEELDKLAGNKKPTKADIDDAKQFFKFLGEIDKVHWKKITLNPELMVPFVIKFKGDPKLKSIIENFPDPSQANGFYKKLSDNLLDGSKFKTTSHIVSGKELDKAKIFFNDIKNNPALLDKFKNKPRTLDAFDILIPRGVQGKLKKDIPTLDKMADLMADSDFMKILANSDKVEEQLTAFSNIFLSLGSQNKARFAPPCSVCTSSRKYLKNAPDLLSDIQSFVKSYSGIMGSKELFGKLRQGSQGDFDEIAQSARIVTLRNDLSANNLQSVGGNFPNGSDKQFDFELKNNKGFIELKSFDEGSILGTDIVPAMHKRTNFSANGQFGEYLAHPSITDISKLSYTFDQRKLLSQFGHGSFATKNDALLAIKEQFQMVFQKVDADGSNIMLDYLRINNPILLNNLGINNARLFSNHINNLNNDIYKFIKIE